MILLHASRKKIAWFFLAMGLFSLSATRLQAVVIQDPGAGDTNGTTAPADDPGWANVGLASSTCIYLGNGWALTAAHVAANVHSGDSMYLNNSTYTVDQTPIRLNESLTSTNPIDLSLIHISTLPTGLASLPISSVKPPTGASVTGIGYGYDQQTSITYWDANWNEVSQANSVHSGFKLVTSRLVQRWGTNNVAADAPYGNPVDVGTWGINYEIYTTFNSNQGGSEFQAVEHDSGGGVFYKDSNGVWNLAGIIELVDNPLTGQPDNTALFRDSTSIYTGNTLSIDLSKYRDQIVNQVQIFQISSMVANPPAYIGSGWRSVQLIGNAGFGSSTGSWSIPIDTNGFNFTVDSGASTVNILPGTGTATGIISGGGGLTKNGTGTLILSAANTFTGNTHISAGTLKLSNANALQYSTLNYTAGVLAFDNGVVTHAFTLGGLSGSKAITLKDTANNPVALSVGNNGQSTTYSGAIDGGGSLTKIGSGALTLTGALSYTGNTTVSGGVLTVSNIDTPAATVSVLGAGSTLNATSIVADTLNISSSGGTNGVVPALASQNVNIVPEPCALALLLLGLLSLGAVQWLRRGR